MQATEARGGLFIVKSMVKTHSKSSKSDCICVLPGTIFSGGLSDPKAKDTHKVAMSESAPCSAQSKHLAFHSRCQGSSPVRLWQAITVEGQVVILHEAKLQHNHRFWFHGLCTMLAWKSRLMCTCIHKPKQHYTRLEFRPSTSNDSRFVVAV